MDYVTLIVVPEADAPVRRRRVPRAALRYGPALVLLLTLASITLGVDWLRLRLEAVDLAALRARAAGDRAALAELTAQLAGLEARVGRVADFERKVRIVADLPGGAALASAASPAVGGEEEGAGGDAPEPVAEPAADASPAPEEGDVAPPPPVSAAPPGAVQGAARADGLDSFVLARVRARVERLLARAAQLDHSLAALVAALGERRARLAAMPSIAPVVGLVTSTFGWRRSPFSGRRQFHAGLDIAAQPGAAFVATAGGRVVFSGVKGALGRAVVLDHGHGLQTTYGHAAALHVRAGQRVARGYRLGTVGSTGHSTGPHVHYAVALRGRAVDPADYLLD